MGAPPALMHGAARTMTRRTRTIGLAVGIGAIPVLALGAKYCPFGKHAVTPVMVREARERAARPATSFLVTGTDGRPYSFESLTRDNPLAIVFIKDGCPCSDS